MHFYIDEINDVLKDINSRLTDIEKCVNDSCKYSDQVKDLICRYNSITSHLWEILQDLKEI